MNVINGSPKNSSQSSSTGRSANVANQKSLSNNQHSDGKDSSSNNGEAEQSPTATQCLANDPSSIDTLRNQPSTIDSLAFASSALDRLIDGPSMSRIPDTQEIDWLGSTPAPPSNNLKQDTNTPDTSDDAVNADAKRSDPRVAVETAESKTSAASITGSIVEGGLNTVRDHVDRTGRASAAATLTKGNAGNLPATGFANRTALANEITNPTNTAARALDVTPYGPNAASSQRLASAASSASNLGKAAGILGTVAGPLVGAYEGHQGAPQDASVGDRVANTIGGGLKEFDDTLVGVGAGVIATGLSGAAALSLVSGGVTAPAAPAVVVSTPAMAGAAAITASTMYDGSTADKNVDSFIDNYVEPVISKTVDSFVSVSNTAGSWLSGAADKVRSWL